MEWLRNLFARWSVSPIPGASAWPPPGIQLPAVQPEPEQGFRLTDGVLLKTVARARLAGDRKMGGKAFERLPDGVRGWSISLSPRQLQIVSAARASSLIAHLQGRHPIRGLPLPTDKVTSAHRRLV